MQKPEYTQLVAEEVRALLARRSVPQGRLADHLGIAESTLSGRLKGNTTFDVFEIAMIATVLDIDARDIMPSIGTRSAA